MIDISTYRGRVGSFNLSRLGKIHASHELLNTNGRNFSSDFFISSYFPSFDSAQGGCILIKVGGGKQVLGPVSFFLSYFYITFMLVTLSFLQLSVLFPVSPVPSINYILNASGTSCGLSFLGSSSQNCLFQFILKYRY